MICTGKQATKSLLSTDNGDTILAVTRWTGYASSLFIGWQTRATAGCAFLLSSGNSKQSLLPTHFCESSGFTHWPVSWSGCPWKVRCTLLSRWPHLGAILTVLLAWLLWSFYTHSIPFSPRCPLRFSTKEETGLKGLVHLSIMNPPDAGGFTNPLGSDSQWGM